MERIQANGVGISRVEISLVDFKTSKRCTRGDSVGVLRRMPNIADSLAERSEFELSVPII
jgi:hypothetical protein